MKVDVLLYGHLRKFGRKFSVDIDSPREAIQFLFQMVPGFESHMEKHAKSGFRMILDGEDSDEKRLYQPLFGVKQIKLVPVVSGAKSDGVQFLVGAAIIAAVGFSGGLAGAGYFGSLVGTSALSNVAVGIGISMMIGGVSQMLSSNPSVNSSSGGITPDYSAGKFFSGPTNTYGQGACVPVRYGKVRCGGHIISASRAVETYATGANGGAFQGGNGHGGSTGDGDSTPLVYSLNPA